MYEEKSDTHQKIIKEAYSKAVTSDAPYVNGEQIMATDSEAIFALAGYSLEGLAEIDSHILEHNFACGNPIDIARINQGETVLDLGCGTGLDVILAAEKVGYSGRVIGIDMTDEMLTIAQTKVDSLHLDNVELKNAMIESIPLENSSVDKVISNCVINLSSDKRQVMDEVYRVLKPGGSISFSDIVIGDNIPKWILKQAALYATCVSGATQLENYLHIMKSVGFKNIKVAGFKTYTKEEILSVLDLEATKIKEGVGEFFFNRMLNAVSGSIHSVHLYADKS
ncbi:methyltransferase domain-containing protein [Shewanella surugensis]|uniref:Arsenite methyltransferase n=1 Tax=Shewanella surugensis TaxID=212020 RepID=A0ABT0L8H9_9GAMM|nr:methyltransferase domain-containing protein [Shewanella surugensis]MCL1123950.1 methyltransferase domain-containing protein [Shewanella surugensis]